MTTKKPSVKLRPGRVWPISLDSASKRLGITKPHLYHVLTGHRVSHDLSKRYQALVDEFNGGGCHG